MTQSTQPDSESDFDSRTIFHTAVEGCLSWQRSSLLQFSRLGESIWFRSDIRDPLFNTVIQSDAALPIFRSTVTKILEDRGDRPFAWLLPANGWFSTEHRQVLSDHGFTEFGHTTAMHLAPARMDSLSDSTPSLNLSLIPCPSARLENWAEVIVEAYGFNPQITSAWMKLHQEIGDSDSSGWTHFVAHLPGDKTTVGACSIFEGSRALSIANFAVRAACQGRGIGRALLREALQWTTKNRPGLPITLFAAKAAIPLYHSLGFEQRERMELYLLR